MKKLFTQFFFFILTFTYAQDCDIWLEQMTDEVEKNNSTEAIKMMKWFVNCKGNELGTDHPVIKNLETISFISKFENGFAICKLMNGKPAIVNQDFTQIKPLQYDQAIRFRNGFARVESNKKYGYINYNGDEIIEVQYDDTQIDFEKETIPVKLNGKWGVINTEGQTIIPFEYTWIYSNSEGFYLAKQNGFYGYLNKKGETIIPFLYEDAKGFREELAAVKKMKNGDISTQMVKP